MRATTHSNPALTLDRPKTVCQGGAPQATRGFSMVELLVAMTISLIGMIIIFQVFEVSEGIKRTTTSGGDAQQNGAIALYMIDQDVRNAGMGFNDTAYAGCNITAYDSTRSPTTFPTAPATMLMVPVGAMVVMATFLTRQGFAWLALRSFFLMGSQPLVNADLDQLGKFPFSLAKAFDVSQLVA